MGVEHAHLPDLFVEGQRRLVVRLVTGAAHITVSQAKATLHITPFFVSSSYLPFLLIIIEIFNAASCQLLSFCFNKFHAKRFGETSNTMLKL